MGLQEELIAALDAQRVVTGADELRRHGTDEGWHAPAAPDVVVYPRDTEEAAAVVRICRDHATPIVPFGAGTSLEGHVAALKGGVSVDTTQMDKILRLSVEDMDVTVQAGVTRRQLDAKLRPEGVFFSVDPGADATIGGMAATGASGTTSVRYGTMRENVLSLTVVTAEGEVVRTRSRARKSSAGYDLTRLFVGSEGTLGPDHRGHAARAADARVDDRRRVRVRDARGRRELRDRGARQRDPGRPHRAARRRPDRRRQPPLRDATSPSARRCCSSSTARPRTRRAQAKAVGEIADGARRPRLRLGRRRERAAQRSGTPATAPTRRAARCAPAPAASRPTPACRSRGSPSASRRPRPTSTSPACWPRSSATSATATSTSRSWSTRTTRMSLRAPRRSTTGSSAARSRWTAPAPANTASDMGSRRSWSSSTGRPAWRMMRAVKSALDPTNLFNPGKVAQGAASGVIQLGLRFCTD